MSILNMVLLWRSTTDYKGKKIGDGQRPWLWFLLTSVDFFPWVELFRQTTLVGVAFQSWPTDIYKLKNWQKLLSHSMQPYRKCLHWNLSWLSFNWTTELSLFPAVEAIHSHLSFNKSPITFANLHIYPSTLLQVHSHRFRFRFTTLHTFCKWFSYNLILSPKHPKKNAH